MLRCRYVACLFKNCSREFLAFCCVVVEHICYDGSPVGRDVSRLAHQEVVHPCGDVLGSFVSDCVPVSLYCHQFEVCCEVRSCFCFKWRNALCLGIACEGQGETEMSVSGWKGQCLWDGRY